MGELSRAGRGVDAERGEGSVMPRPPKWIGDFPSRDFCIVFAWLYGDGWSTKDGPCIWYSGPRRPAHWSGTARDPEVTAALLRGLRPAPVKET